METGSRLHLNTLSQQTEKQLPLRSLKFVSSRLPKILCDEWGYERRIALAKNSTKICFWSKCLSQMFPDIKHNLFHISLCN